MAVDKLAIDENTHAVTDALKFDVVVGSDPDAHPDLNVVIEVNDSGATVHRRPLRPVIPHVLPPCLCSADVLARFTGIRPIEVRLCPTAHEIRAALTTGPMPSAAEGTASPEAPAPPARVGGKCVRAARVG